MLAWIRRLVGRKAPDAKEKRQTAAAPPDEGPGGSGGFLDPPSAFRLTAAELEALVRHFGRALNDSYDFSIGNFFYFLAVILTANRSRFSPAFLAQMGKIWGRIEGVGVWARDREVLGRALQDCPQSGVLIEPKYDCPRSIHVRGGQPRELADKVADIIYDYVRLNRIERKTRPPDPPMPQNPAAERDDEDNMGKW